ncbi:MAG: 5-oxoprolinase subunit PxpA [Fidelibacterota bacterium]|jgi:UPF0271 protein
MIDINSDMGELTHLFEDRTYHQLIDHVTSINLACGGHAGNTTMMTELSKLAKLKNVRIGAHPGYPDPDNLGRAVMNMDPRDLTQTILEQIRRLGEIVSAENEQLFHVKPHGALYNQAAKDKTISRSIGEAVLKFDPNLVMIGLSGSIMLHVWQDMGLQIMEEAFGDRTYESDGSLRNRDLDHALITDPKKAAQQAQMITNEGKVISFDGSDIHINVQTICIHSDTPNALDIAKKVNEYINKE